MKEMKYLLTICQVTLIICLISWPCNATNTTDHNNVVIVLDASGSMNAKMDGSTPGTQIKKMTAAKEALLEVLRQVPDDTHIGLLVFSSGNSSGAWAYPLGPRDDAQLTAAIMQPQPGGGTPLGRFIKIGADRLLEQREKQYGYGTYRLLVVTDGEANDKSKMERYVPEAMSRGITLDVIGVKMEKSHTLATKAHSYRSANNPESLKQAISDVFAEVAFAGTDTAGEDAFAEIAPIPHEMAQDMLKALATSGNQPIGARRRSESSNGSDQTGKDSSNQSASQSGKKKAESSPLNFKLILGMMVLVIVVRAIKKKRKKR